MMSTKIVLTVIGMVIVGMIVYRYALQSGYTKESFWMLPQQTYRVERVMAPNKAAAERGEFHSVPANYQSLLSPRFSNTDMSANIRKELPHPSNLASPDAYGTQPYRKRVAFSDMTRDNDDSNSQEEDYHPAKDNDTRPEQDNQYPEASDMMPVGDMTEVNEVGEDSQPVIYDRYIYSNRNSRLRSQGDPIRGDLPIVPCGGDWFRPSARPNVDLQQGAMNVLAGEDNDTTKALSQLINASSGGGQTAIAGSNVNMGNQFETELSAGQNDVQVTEFP